MERVPFMSNSQADYMMQRAKLAAAELAQLSQAQVDAIVKAAFEAAFDARIELASMAVKETGRGVFEDKVIKNSVASLLVYEDIRSQKTVGLISSDHSSGIDEYATPVGPVLAIVPVTNPTSTVIFKILIALKTRNPIIISAHRNAVQCCSAAARLMLEAVVQVGACPECIQWIEQPSRELTQALMSHSDLGLVLATGGSGLVKAAYCSGKPAYGVGPGNVPVFVDNDTDPDEVARSIVSSKTFDNGTICATEQAVICLQSMDSTLRQAFSRAGAYWVEDPAERARLAEVVFDTEKGMMAADAVGMSAQWIADKANIKVGSEVKLLMVPCSSTDLSEPFAHEILAPVLAYYVAPNFDDALKQCISINHTGGLGHTAAIYSHNAATIEQFAKNIEAGRIVVNTPAAQGAVGGIFNALTPSLTLGCGSLGNNITTDNVSVRHLLNMQRVVSPKVNQHWLDAALRLLESSLMAADAVQLYEHKPHQSRHTERLTQAGITVFSFPERVDHSWLQSNAELLELICQKKTSIEFDMRHTTYISSAFLRLCLQSAKQLEANGLFLSIQHCRPEVYRVFSLAGFHQILSVA